MRDQWRDDDHRGYRDRRPHHSDLRHRSPIPTGGEGGSRGVKSKGQAASRATSPSYRGRDRSRSPRAAGGKHSQHSQNLGDRSEGPRKARRQEDKLSKRNRHRDDRSSANHAKRYRSISSEYRRHHTEQERRRGLSPRQRRRASPGGRHRSHHYSPTSPRRDHYASSRQQGDPQSDWYSRESYPSYSRRGRSRSPVTLDHYRPDNTRRPSPSSHSYRRHHHDEHRYRDSRRTSPSRLRDHSTEPKSRRRDSRGVSPEKPSKSSRRSEKQKQRTLRHLRAKNRANDFLRQLSVSPQRRSSRADEQRMQQSTRPIQSILDEPSHHQISRGQSRNASPPRPIPSFDDSAGGPDSHIREQFPLHGMKATDVHPNHRRPGPAHIDTRQQYATSPQYMTPTSSHHGSPHSGSPYNQGRGGWPGHYMAQSG